jgi:MATE family multidrug resistance protein
MRNAMVLSTAGYLGAAYLLQPLLGNHGLFLAMTLFMVLRALTLGWYYPTVLRAIPVSTPG